MTRLSQNTVRAIREFADENFDSYTDTFGRGWDHSSYAEVSANLAVQADLSCDAFDANLLLEEALCMYRQQGHFYVGAHRARKSPSQSACVSDDACDRARVNQIYADSYFED